jgi:hypothetical protein
MPHLSKNLLLACLLFLCIGFIAQEGFGQAVQHVSGTISADATWSSSKTYIVDDDLIIDTNVTLTIESGTIVKFAVFDDETKKVTMTVKGIMDTMGTAQKPIIFTSLRDDSSGGDSNGDGSATTPLGGDWGFIRLTNGDNTLHDSKIMYGGLIRGYYPNWSYANRSVWIDKCAAKVQNNQIINPYEEAIYCGGPVTTQATISGNTIKGFKSGIYCFNASPTISNNILSNGQEGALDYAFTQDGSSFPIYTSNTVDSSCYEAICVLGTMGDGGGTWVNVENKSLPYLLIGDLTIEKGNTLTVPAGTIVKFDYADVEANKICIYVDGVLDAQATEYYPVIFTSIYDDTVAGDTNGDGSATQPGAGNWGYIKLDNSDNNFHNCIVKYGGDKIGYYPNWVQVPYCIWVDGCNAKVRDNQIISPFDVGICARGPVYNTALISGNTIKDFQEGIYTMSASPTITNNKLQQAKSTGLHYAYVQDGASFPLYSGNTIDTSCLKAIIIKGKMESGGGTWINVENRGWPYLLIKDLTIDQGAILTISAGTIIKFGYASPEGDKVCIYADGKLDVQGTPKSPVIFTSNRDDDNGGDTNSDGNTTSAAAGDWGFVKITNSQTVILNTKFMFGGKKKGYNPNWTDVNYNIWIDGGKTGNLITPSIKKSSISYSFGDGIRCDNKAIPEINGCEFTLNANGVHCTTGALPGIVYCNIYDNAGFGVINDDSLTVVKAESNWWGNANGPSGQGPGSGDAVSTYVDYDPWLNAPKTLDEMEFGLSITPQKASYSSGDSMTLLLDLQSLSVDTNADIYFVVLQSTTGNLYFGLPWTLNPAPAISSFTIPANLSFSKVPLIPIAIPGTPQPVGMPGTYTFAIAAVTPGSLNFISNIATASFLVK